MPTFLSQEWLDLQRTLAADLPELPAASARMQLAVTGTPTGEVRYVQVIEDGRITSNELGSDDDVELTLTQTVTDATAIARGELDVSVGVMQGRVKFAGNMGAFMAVMPLLQSEGCRRLLATVAETTDF